MSMVLVFENTVEKGENADNLLLQCFLLNYRDKSSFKQHLICRLQVPLIWSCSKFCRLGNNWLDFYQIL